MKLKVLPPTLRKNHHYLVLDVKSEVEISKEDMLVYCWDACIRYWGENHSSNFDLWVMRHYLIEESTKNNEAIFNYKTVLRCGMGDARNCCASPDLSDIAAAMTASIGGYSKDDYENDVRVALSTLTRQNKRKIAINTIGVSGTVKSGISKFIGEDNIQ